MNGPLEPRDPYLVITGASRGIGLATAKVFLQSGHKVINISRSAAPIDDIIHLGADLLDPHWQEGIAEELSRLVAGAGPLVLVHNAALQVHGGVDQLDADTMRQVLELNVVAPVTLNRLLIDKMQPGSSIIYVGSTLSFKATANVAAYVTSKHALLGLMRSTCQDLAGSEIHTACVCPGFTDTEMLREYGGETIAQLEQLSTQNRLVKPEEVAKCIHFCAESPAVNGTLLRADLGLVEH